MPPSLAKPSPSAFNMTVPQLKTSSRLTPQEMAREPFRIFFPAGVLAGIVGVLLWPLYFWGITEFYPGTTHPRIMAYGLFGGFIFGFLGTAMPRMLSAQPFRLAEAGTLLVLHLAMVIAFALSKVLLGEVFFLLALIVFFTCLLLRVGHRKDTPPPGFVLVGMALLCVTAGSVLSLLQNFREMDAGWVMLQRLLCYQGFVLLPILGIGPFLLPRFFGMPNRHDLPEALRPSVDWWKKAGLAIGAGVLIVGSFFVEVFGWPRVGHALRFVTTLAYIYLEMPLHRAPKAGHALGASIRVALFCVLAGFFAVAFFPGYRVSLLHLTLIGGFAGLMFVVATRVVFGHSGQLAALKGRNRWLLVSVGLMLFGTATRMSGDFWPKVMASHYVYGAILWIGGVILWSCYVLPKVLTPDTED